MSQYIPVQVTKIQIFWDMTLCWLVKSSQSNGDYLPKDSTSYTGRHETSSSLLSEPETSHHTSHIWYIPQQEF